MTTKKQRPTQSRNYCFTDFKLLDFDAIWLEYSDIIRYMCRGLEICPTTKKKHYQGWIQFKNKKRIGGVKKILSSNQIHLESCRGNEYDNDKYCMKENDFKTWGKFISQGYRTDLEIVTKIIKNDGNMSEIADQIPSMVLRYSHGLKELIRIEQKKKSKKFRKIQTFIHYGDTGTGKTRCAVESTEDHYLISGDSLNWFDGYEGESTLIIDEYNNNVPIDKMLRLLDGYQYRLPIKGGFTYARWTTIHITTNLDKDMIHANAKTEHRLALWRRITKWKHYTKLKVCRSDKR